MHLLAYGRKASFLVEIYLKKKKMCGKSQEIDGEPALVMTHHRDTPLSETSERPREEPDAGPFIRAPA